MLSSRLTNDVILLFQLLYIIMPTTEICNVKWELHFPPTNLSSIFVGFLIYNNNCYIIFPGSSS